MYVIASFLLIAFIGVYKAYKNTHEFVVNRVKIDSPLETTGTHLNILHISDMHLENISVTPERLYETLKHEKIDLIALTGDFLDRKRSIPKLHTYLKIFQQLHPSYGTYAVFGNHDYVLKDTHLSKLEETLLQYGVTILRNENESIDVDGTFINLIGIDNFGTGHSDLQKSYHHLREGAFNLVLTHDPNVVLDMKSSPFDYLLSGHFHGGQIHWPKPYHLIKMGKLVRLNMVKGLHHIDGKPFYISEGLGQTGFNIRVGSRPEITLHTIDIEHAQDQGEAAS